MVLSDRNAADIRAREAEGKAHATMRRNLQTNRGNQALAFRQGLHEAVPELLRQLCELYASLDGAEDVLEAELVAEITKRITAFIQSSLAGQRGSHVASAAREAARQTSSVEVGVKTSFKLAVHDHLKRKRAAPAPSSGPANRLSGQYEALLELVPPNVRLLERGQRYIELLGDDAGVASRIARRTHLDHFRTADRDLREIWSRHEPAVFDGSVREAFSANRIAELVAKLEKLSDADRDEWDITVRNIHDEASDLDGALRRAIGAYQRSATVPTADASEHEFMAAAIEEARKSKHEPNKTPLYVGAVLVKDGKIIARGHRGEHKLGEHAEFTMLERNLPDPGAAANATLYCTLEPCIVRNPPKTPCADWIVSHRIARVVLGVIDPDRRIRGGGVRTLRKAGIDVALFPHRFANEIEALNGAFERQHDNAGPEPPRPNVRGFNTPGTIPEIFYEWRRWENPTGTLDEFRGVFDKAWLETNEDGERAIWDVCVVTASDTAGFFERASAVASRMAILRTDSKAMHYTVVAAVVGDAPGDAERGAKDLMAQAWPSKLGVRVLFGWIAKHHFVSEALMVAA